MANRKHVAVAVICTFSFIFLIAGLASPWTTADYTVGGSKTTASITFYESCSQSGKANKICTPTGSLTCKPLKTRMQAGAAFSIMALFACLILMYIVFSRIFDSGYIAEGRTKIYLVVGSAVFELLLLIAWAIAFGLKHVGGGKFCNPNLSDDIANKYTVGASGVCLLLSWLIWAGAMAFEMFVTYKLLDDGLEKAGMQRSPQGQIRKDVDPSLQHGFINGGLGISTGGSYQTCYAPLSPTTPMSPPPTPMMADNNNMMQDPTVMMAAAQQQANNAANMAVTGSVAIPPSAMAAGGDNQQNYNDTNTNTTTMTMQMNINGDEIKEQPQLVMTANTDDDSTQRAGEGNENSGNVSVSMSMNVNNNAAGQNDDNTAGEDGSANVQVSLTESTGENGEMQIEANYTAMEES